MPGGVCSQGVEEVRKPTQEGVEASTPFPAGSTLPPIVNMGQPGGTWTILSMAYPAKTLIKRLDRRDTW